LFQQILEDFGETEFQVDRVHWPFVHDISHVLNIVNIAFFVNMGNRVPT